MSGQTFSGEWNTVDDPSNKKNGTLTLIENIETGGTLDIDGYYGILEEFVKAKNKYNIIHGRSNNNDLTLVKCILKSSNIDIKNIKQMTIKREIGKPPTVYLSKGDETFKSSYSVKTIFVGHRFTDVSELRFKELSFGLFNLGFWFEKGTSLDTIEDKEIHSLLETIEIGEFTINFQGNVSTDFEGEGYSRTYFDILFRRMFI